ncbi:MAG: hypothetical protein H0W36_00520 [Gemmatimonadetes bacterium]|nr:hypothetical protein [Gemmatimonadota bacterium]
MSTLPLALASDPDLVLDTIRDDTFPQRPVPCYGCGRADPAEPAWHVVALPNGERRGVCSRCWERADMDVTEPLSYEDDDA